jgi:acetylornithine deacetylase
MNALQYAQQLIEFDSVSCNSNVPISECVERHLQDMGFDIERLEYEDACGVAKANVIGKKGPGTGGLAYFGHTDVVPADDWHSDENGPFQPVVREGKLIGRGACDMKGSVACLLAAARQFAQTPLQQPLYIVCTADEEIGYGGAEFVAARSELYGEILAGGSQAVIGEPTSLQVVYAHKGTYGFRATARGKAAHSSTRSGVNANLAMIPFLMEMKRIHDETESDPHWTDQRFDPPTICWNIGINDHTHAVNITAPQSVCTVYFRPMPGQDPDRLLQRAQAAADEYGIELDICHRNPPVYTPPDSEFVQRMLAVTGNQRPLTVPYGTDGSRFHDLRNMVVFGPGDIAQAHTFDEWIALDQLENGARLFARMIDDWCCRAPS